MLNLASISFFIAKKRHFSCYSRCMYYTYILRCSDGSLYTGYTNDLSKREATHNTGKGSRYTRARRPVRLVYHESFDNRHEAMRREWEIKQLKKHAKETMILSQKT